MVSDDGYGNSATVDFIAVGVVNRKRLKKKPTQYTNLKCEKCQEWWIMLCLGSKKKVYCPWCGEKCRITSTEKIN